MASYNHYTPQSDGSYRRSTVPDARHHRPPGGPSVIPSQPGPEGQPVPPPPPPPPQIPANLVPPPGKSEATQSIGAFLRGLLPRQIDAADLLVISLLLLMNREEAGEEGLSPLLTIALYFLL